MAAKVVGTCPHCAAFIQEDHFGPLCSKCGEALPQAITELLVPAPEAGAQPAKAPAAPTRVAVDSLSGRYTDAYRVASAIIAFGTTIKVLGVIIASVIALLSLAAGNNPFGGAARMLTGLVFAGISGLLFWVGGVFVTAQGQLLRASLDVAVNTSPLLDDLKRAQIMGVAS